MEKNIHFVLILLFLSGVLSCDNSTESKSNTLTLQLHTSHVSIYNGSDGAINLTVSGGSPPYQYQWSNGDTTEDISNLIAGNYTVNVQDVNGERASDSTKINQPANPLLGRSYRRYIPVSYTGVTPVPLVIAMHFRGSNGYDFEGYTGFSNVADTAGFIVVYPNATGSPSEWNAGLGFTPSTLTVDDVGFISVLIDTFKSDYNIDSNRVFITGMSVGSILSYRLAAELSNKISAIGAVAGHATSPMMNSLNPDHPVAIIHFHMLDDPSISYNGGTLNGVNYPALENVLAAWRAINNCQSTPSIIENAEEVYACRWDSIDSHADIVLYRIAAGGHTWPKDPISATKLIWKFFKNLSR